jgi:hypothetical protein
MFFICEVLSTKRAILRGNPNVTLTVEPLARCKIYLLVTS